MNDAPRDAIDCVVIGGGPAGLTAALYLARFDRRFIVIDNSQSRAAWIPESHNVPLFTRGIGGGEILRRQREHAEAYGARIAQGTVSELSRISAGFSVSFERPDDEKATVQARFAILATGVADIPPRMPDVEPAVQSSLIRYCPICDGYEAKGKSVGVIGLGNQGLGEACFIARTYAAKVTLLSFHEPLLLSDGERRNLAEHGIRLIPEPITSLSCDGGKIAAHGAGARCEFDVMYSALGVYYRSDLAAALGATRNEAGALNVGEHAETNVPGLYAAGDVTEGLNQIVVGMAQAARAATHIHNQFR
jgi:thioredoxin reductase (NADPH)